MKSLRRFLIFLAILTVGLAGLWLLTRGESLPQRRGLRIQAVDADPAERVPPPFPSMKGLPRLLGSDQLEVSRFEHLRFPEAPGVVFEVLAWHLELGGVEVVTQRALHPQFTLYPRPGTAEEARAYGDQLPEQLVLLRADEATILRRVMTSPLGTGADQGEQWELNLNRNVSVASQREGQAITLLADDLSCLSSDRRVSARGRVRVTADEYVIAGKGLAGDAALGTFSVLEQVDLTLPTAALIGDRAPATDRRTRVTSGGPLLVERLGSAEEEGPVPTRVRFENGARVHQDNGEESPPDTLEARELTLRLLVTRKEAGSTPDVAVEDVRADGDVVLTRGSGSRVTAAAVHLTSSEAGDRVELSGPLSIHHEGALPDAGSLPGPEDAVLRVTARDSATIETGGRDDPIRTRLAGAVSAHREDREGKELLSLTARVLEVTSDPQEGETMVATGAATFSSPTASGRADRIEWHRGKDGREVIRLEGSPRVEVVGGGGFNPFGAPGEKLAAGGPGTLLLRSDGPMTVTSTEDHRELELTDGVHIAKVVEGQEVLFLEAARVTGRFQQDTLETLTAEGEVAASGRGEGRDSGTYMASGSRIVYSHLTGDAVLTGSPALVRLKEEGDQVNEIQAGTLTFRTASNLFVAEDEVTAVVYLAEAKGGRVRPYTLSCLRLEVVTAPPAEADDSGKAPSALGKGRISSLLAVGPLTLKGRDRMAAGDRLTYQGRDAQTIELIGKPARLTQSVVIGAETYEDEFESDVLTLTLAERDIERAAAPQGARFRLHRPFGKGSPKVLGTTLGDRDQVERFVGACSGTASYDPRVARLTGNAWIEQYAGQGASFSRIARFAAQKIEAWQGQRSDGRAEIVRARGEGRVKGTGTDWEVNCDFFEVDLSTHRTRMKGSPAEVLRKGFRQLVDEAVYDYEKDEWVELVGPRKG